MPPTTEALTLGAYAAHRDGGDDLTELVRGAVVHEPRPSAQHGRVQFELARRLGNWIRERGGGEVLGESGFIIREEPATVRGPDIAVLLEAPRPVSTGGWILGSPDIAIEILSPSDTSSEVQLKLLDYLEAGGSRVWLVDPATRMVTVYRADRSGFVLREDDTLHDEELLPGFSVELSELFG